MVDFLAKEIGWRKVIKLIISIPVIAFLFMGALFLGDVKEFASFSSFIFEALLAFNSSF